MNTRNTQNQDKLLSFSEDEWQEMLDSPASSFESNDIENSMRKSCELSFGFLVKILESTKEEIPEEQMACLTRLSELDLLKSIINDKEKLQKVLILLHDKYKIDFLKLLGIDAFLLYIGNIETINEIFPTNKNNVAKFLQSYLGLNLLEEQFFNNNKLHESFHKLHSIAEAEKQSFMRDNIAAINENCFIYFICQTIYPLVNLILDEDGLLRSNIRDSFADFVGLTPYAINQILYPNHSTNGDDIFSKRILEYALTEFSNLYPETASLEPEYLFLFQTLFENLNFKKLTEYMNPNDQLRKIELNLKYICKKYSYHGLYAKFIDELDVVGWIHHVNALQKNPRYDSVENFRNNFLHSMQEKLSQFITRIQCWKFNPSSKQRSGIKIGFHSSKLFSNHYSVKDVRQAGIVIKSNLAEIKSLATDIAFLVTGLPLSYQVTNQNDLTYVENNNRF